MLEVLSENRNLKSHVEEAERMLTQIEIERLPSYAIGLERGLERGRAIAQRLMVRQLLNSMDAAAVAGVLGLSPDEITHLAAEDDGADTA